MFLNRRYSGDGNYAPQWPFILNQNSPLAQGLVGWWPSGLIGGGVIYDFSSGGNRDATLGGAVWQAHTLAGSCLHFDGSDDYADTASTPVSVEPLTMACWFKPGRVTAAEDLMVIAPAAGTGDAWRLRAAGNVNFDPVQAISRDGAESEARSTGPGFFPGDGHTWYLATSIHVSNTERHAFLDGENKGSDTGNRNPTGTAKVSFGAFRTDGTFNPFLGEIGPAYIWNRALSDDEVWSLYNPPTRWDLYWQPRTIVMASEGPIANNSLIPILKRRRR